MSRFSAGSLVLLDLYGQNHDPDLWTDLYTFDPQRFVDRPIGRDELAPRRPRPRHRAPVPGEDITIAAAAGPFHTAGMLGYDVPKQDLMICLPRAPARPRSGAVISAAHPHTD